MTVAMGQNSTQAEIFFHLLEFMHVYAVHVSEMLTRVYNIYNI
jgi:hypothetical protein